MPFNTTDKIFDLHRADSPIVATAIHNGHTVRSEVEEAFAISEADRLREEDPFTGRFTDVAPTRIIGLRSRFEVDLNRPREKAVYITPDDAWGLKVWKHRPPADLIERSLAEYDEFYREVERLLTGLESRFGRFVVLDLHSYNHRRDGADKPAADPALNPEIIVGTSNMRREYWAPVVDRFINDLRQVDFPGHNLDVRENVKFRGGNFSRWIHDHFPDTGCALAIEFKKTFMDEWTGELYPETFALLKQALASTIPGIIDELSHLN